MASESSAGFHHQQQGILSKFGGATSSSNSGSGGCELIPMGNYNYRNGGGSLNLSGNDGPRGEMIFSSQNSLDSCLTHVLNSVPGLKHDTGFAVEWSLDEQYKLDEGLAKYAYEPNIIRYIKIAASLRDKTVRDVALRCRWVMRKRRKQEHLRKTVKDQKEKLAESALISSAPSSNVAPYYSTTNHHNQSDCKLLGVLSGTARHLLEENNQAFEQIFVNLSTLKLSELAHIPRHIVVFPGARSKGLLLQQNIDLFFRTRNNIIAILNGMRNMPGIMSQMPPLPVLLNEELASTIFPPSSQLSDVAQASRIFGVLGQLKSVSRTLKLEAMMLSSSSTNPVKQEPGC